MRVSAGNHQSQHRESHFMISLLPLFEQDGVDVAFQMVDRDQRLIQGKGESFCVTDPHQQGSCESGTLSYRDGIDRIVGMAGFGEGLANHWHNRPQMFAGSQFGDDSSILLMSRDLGCDHVRNQLLARTHHGGRGFIAGAFNAEDVSVSHASILVEARGRNLATVWLSRNSCYSEARMLTTKGQRYDETGPSG